MKESVSAVILEATKESSSESLISGRMVPVLSTEVSPCEGETFQSNYEYLLLVNPAICADKNRVDPCVGEFSIAQVAGERADLGDLSTSTDFRVGGALDA